MQHMIAYVAGQYTRLHNRHSCTRFRSLLGYFFLSHPDLGYKTFLHMLVGSTTLPCSLASRWMECCWKLHCFKTEMGAINFWAAKRPFRRDPSEDDLENNRQKQFNANSRAGEMSVEKCTQKYVLTQQTMVSRDACPTDHPLATTSKCKHSR